RHHRSDSDACCAFRRKSIDAGRDRRKCDRAQALFGSERKRGAITRRQQFFLALLAAAPNRAYGVDDVLGLQPITAGHLGGAALTAAERSALGEKFGPGGAMDSAVHATAAEQGTVGSVDDGIDIQRGDVGNTDFEPGRSDLGREKRSAHEQILAQSPALAQRRNGLQLLVLLSQLRLCPSGKIYRAAAADILKMGVKETSRRTLTEFAQHLEIVVVGLQRPARAERFVQILHSDTMEAQ